MDCPQVLYPCLRKAYPRLAGWWGHLVLANMYMEPEYPIPFYYLEVGGGEGRF